MKIKEPIADRVVIRPKVDEEVKSSGGLIVPDLGKDKSLYGTVVAVGPGCYQGNVFVTPKVQVGDTVIYPKFGCHTLEVDGEELLIIRELELFAIMEKTPVSVNKTALRDAINTTEPAPKYFMQAPDEPVIEKTNK